MDALADHPNQVDKSPFAYGWNNPISNTDPDGNCPNCRELFLALDKALTGGKIGRTLETVVGFVPGAGQIMDLAEAATGREMFTDEPLSGGQRLMALIPGKIEKVGDAANAIVKNADEVSEIKKVRNPYGSKGKPDHQAKVDELAEMARAENPGMDVVTERKIQVDGSRRRPDVQVVDPSTGTTTRIYEAERQPNSTRNRRREAEYDRLEIPHKTYKVGGN